MAPAPRKPHIKKRKNLSEQCVNCLGIFPNTEITPYIDIAGQTQFLCHNCEDLYEDNQGIDVGESVGSSSENDTEEYDDDYYPNDEEPTTPSSSQHGR